MKRNSFVYIFKLTQLIIIALITMTLFLRTKMHRDTVTDGGIFLGALFFTVIMIMFNGMSELAMTIAKLPVFYKQRDLLFYPSWAYALPTWILKIPIIFIEVAVWVFITYHVIGFDPNVERLFKQFILLVLVNQMASSLFRFIAAMGRDMIVANTFGSFALLIVFVLGGFILSREDVKKWWKWGYWISPLMYAQNAIVANEFLGNSWKHVLPNSTEPLGVAVLKSRGFFTDAYWYWLGTGAMLGYVFIFNFLFTLALSYLNPFGKSQAVISEETLNQKHADRTGENIELPSRRKNFADPTSSRGEQAQPVRIEAIEEANQRRKQGMVLPFEQLSITFDAIRNSVDMPQVSLQLLMGVSGAGKTTLMDVLAGRKTGGYIEGNITISGYPKKQETFSRISGYCEQNDIHSPHVTVYESLLYSAWLRLPPDVDSATRKMFIEEVMKLVELASLRESLVGLPGVNGLSTEQRKRMTIAVELVANPSIIFMDEPTSGLNARAASNCDENSEKHCGHRKNCVTSHEAGRTGNICGPTGSPFLPFDQVLRASWMLEVTTAAQEVALGVNFTDVYKNSELYRRNKTLISDLSIPPPGSKDLYFPTQYSQSFFTQCIACLWKQHWSYWRNPPYSAVRFFFTTFIAMFFGTVFWDLGSKRESQQDLSNAMGSMFAAVIFLGVQNASSVQPVVSIERTVFYRERATGMYSALPYAFGHGNSFLIMIEIPYIFVQTLRIPMWWRWYYWACPVAWTLYGLVVSQFGDIQDKFLDTDVVVEDFVRSYFGFRHDFLGVVSVAVVGFTLIFAFVFAFAIRVFNFQRR
ncbi:hypothetical protein HHK36_021533 [Tetracentron sinense]|uniref:ABC transporter domain-containing protein n=1 Tax=Tetracentron sinense TaxID=13715 RepID=A0A834YX19_TETSI|nr:hypothetical protein HHK36_021533 [Tetracentron sinense]